MTVSGDGHAIKKLCDDILKKRKSGESGNIFGHIIQQYEKTIMLIYTHIH